MTQVAQIERRRRTPKFTLLTLGALGTAGAAAWLYFRSIEPDVDARTRERLQPGTTRS